MRSANIHKHHPKMIWLYLPCCPRRLFVLSPLESDRLLKPLNGSAKTNKMKQYRFCKSGPRGRRCCPVAVLHNLLCKNNLATLDNIRMITQNYRHKMFLNIATLNYVKTSGQHIVSKNMKFNTIKSDVPNSAQGKFRNNMAKTEEQR